MKTIEDLLETLSENITIEANSQGLETWSIGASGENFADNFQSYTLDDLEELREEILEGQKIQMTIDLSECLLTLIEQMIESNQENYDNEDDDEEEYNDYEDEED